MEDDYEESGDDNEEQLHHGSFSSSVSVSMPAYENARAKVLARRGVSQNGGNTSAQRRTVPSLPLHASGIITSSQHMMLEDDDALEEDDGGNNSNRSPRAAPTAAAAAALGLYPSTRDRVDLVENGRISMGPNTQTYQHYTPGTSSARSRHSERSSSRDDGRNRGDELTLPRLPLSSPITSPLSSTIGRRRPRQTVIHHPSASSVPASASLPHALQAQDVLRGLNLAGLTTTVSAARSVIRDQREAAPAGDTISLSSSSGQASPSLSEGEIDPTPPAAQQNMPWMTEERLSGGAPHVEDAAHILPNALIQHLSSMKYRSRGTMAEQLIIQQNQPDSIHRTSTEGGLVNFYLHLFTMLNAQSEDGDEEGQVSPNTVSASPIRQSSSISPAAFTWPVFEMVEFEFSGEAEGITLEHVLIITNLPLATDQNVSSGLGQDMTDSSSAESPSIMLSRLLRLMLQKVGTVRTVIFKTQAAALLSSPAVIFPTGNTQEHGETPTTTATGQCLAFVEMESVEEMIEASRLLNGFPWSNHRTLQARKFRDYGLESGRAIDEEQEEEEERSMSTLAVGPQSLLSAGSAGEDAWDGGIGVMMTDDDDEGASTSRSGFYTSSSSSTTSSISRPRDICQLLDLLRGPETAVRIREIEKQLELSIRRKDVVKVKLLERGLLKVYMESLVQDNEGSSSSLHEIEGALVRLFDEGAGTARTEDDEEQEEESERKSLWRRCCVAERLRSGEFMRRLKMTECRHIHLLRENRQKHNTISLLQSQRNGMLHHIRQLRSVNQGLSSRNLELMSRLQTHQQVLSRMQMLQERLTECEERMAKASSAHQHLAQRGRGSSLIEGHHGDDDGGGGEGKMIDSFNPSSLAREAERAIQDASLEQLGASERILDGVLEKIRQKRQEKIREEQIKLMRHKEMEDAQKSCCICQDQAKSVLLLPCRHLCVCGPCSRRPELQRCPVCRGSIEEKMTVYA